MEHLLAMQHFQCFEYRTHDLGDTLFGKWLAASTEHLTQRFAAIHAHRHIGGAVAFPETKHLNQGGMRKAGQHLRFVDEALEASVKCGTVVGRANRDLDAINPSSERRRHEFFQCNDTIKRCVLGEIDNAEAALAHQTNNFKVGDACPDRKAIGMSC